MTNTAQKQPQIKPEERPKIVSIGRMPAFGALFYFCQTDMILLIGNTDREDSGQGGKKSILKDPVFRQAIARISSMILASVIFMFTVYQREYYGLKQPYWLFYFMAIACGFMTGLSLMEYVADKLVVIQYREVTSFDPIISATVQKKLKRDIASTLIITLLLLDVCGLAMPWTWSWAAYQEFMPANLLSYITIYSAVALLYMCWSMSPVYWKYKAIKKIRSITISNEEIQEEEQRLNELYNKDKEEKEKDE